MSLLTDGRIAAIIGKTVGGRLGSPGFILRRATGVDADGVPLTTFTQHPCTVTLTDFSEWRKQQSAIPTGDVRLIVYQTGIDNIPLAPFDDETTFTDEIAWTDSYTGGTRVTPRVTDRIRLNGVDYDCVQVTPDPANATWDIQGRPVR